MMIEFEDKQPGPPMSLLMRVEIAVLVVLQVAPWAITLVGWFK